MLAKLLPPGGLWNLESGSWLHRILTALGDEFDRVVARGVDLINESDPRTATETIGDWERTVGLPDVQVPVLPTELGARRSIVIQKLLSRGGQDVGFFVNLASACGWSVALSLTEPLRSGFRCGARCYGGDAWAYAITVGMSNPVANALPLTDTKRIMRAAMHAHIIVVFA